MASLKEKSKEVLEEAEKLNKKLTEQAQGNHDCWLMYEDLQERHEMENEKERKSHNEQIKHWKQICKCLAIVLAFVSIFSIVGFTYMFTNYDFCDFTQNTSDGGNNLAGNNCSGVTFNGNAKN